MSVCAVCDKDMSEASGCVKHQYILKDGTKVNPIKVGGEDDWIEKGNRCGDCNADHGQYHHVGCDLERCSVCGGQFISCDCDYADRILLFQEASEPDAKQ